ncbi:tetratricopeptide repeat protein [Spirosoma pomorum]
MFCLSLSAPAQVMTDASVQQTVVKTLDAIYGQEFAEATSLIRQLQTRYPQHPIGPILRATLLEQQYVPVEQNPTAASQFVQAANQGLALAKQMLERNENDPEGILFAMTAHSYLALLYNNKDESLKAVGESKKAYPYLKQGFELLDQSPDFYLTTGMYNYYVERYPMDHAVVRPFMFFFQDGNMQLGLKQMDVASKKGILTRAGANYYLAHIYLKHEMNPQKAALYSKYLVDEYPANPLYGMRHAEALLLAGRYNEAKPYVQRLKQSSNKLVTMAVLVFDGILDEQAERDDKAASANYQAALKLPFNEAYTKEYHAMAYAGLARVAARDNNRNQAKAYYKKVLSVGAYKSLIKEAKAYNE